MTFDAPEPPQEIKIGYTISKVEKYIPNPLRCFNCQRYGHGKNQCSRKLVCGKCGENDPNHTELTCPNETNCSNCKQNHSAASRDCEVWKKEILKIKHTKKNLFFRSKKKH